MDKLETHLYQLKDIAATVNANELIAEIEELQEKLRNQRLYIVVLGLFKRGKSSLINALLGKSILPVSVTPLTAVITILEYTSGDPFVKIEFLDGSSEKKTINDITTYVSEEENPDNIRKVSLVRIYDQCDLLKLVSLVDTPGLGSAFEHNTATTLQFVPKIDAAIFVLSADTPVSSQDIDFFNELKETVPRILFVMTKIDILGKEDLNKMINHNSNVLSRTLGRILEPSEWLLVSSLNQSSGSLKNGISELAQIIESIGRNEKDALLSKAAFKQYTLFHDRLQILMRFKIGILNMPLNELEQKQKTLDHSAGIMQDQRDEFESIINGKIKLLQDQVHSKVSMEGKLMKEYVHERLNEISDQLQDLGKLKGIQSFLNEFILNHFKEIKDQLENETREQFRKLLEQYSNRSQSFLNELANHLKSLMGISFEIMDGQFDLNIYTSFYLSLDSGIDAFILKRSFLNNLIPKKQRNKSILRSLRNHYNLVIIRNSSSIGYDLEYKIQESFRKFSYDLNNLLSELMKNIKSIMTSTIELKNKHYFLIAGEIEDLKNHLNKLEELQFQNKTSSNDQVL